MNPDVQIDENDAERPSGKDHRSAEDEALELLCRRNLTAAAINSIAHRGDLLKSRKVRLALAEHPATPRHISLPLLSHMLTFDLMRVALAPGVAADIRLAAEEALIRRLETISAGEKTTLARRASGRVAGALLRESDMRVIKCALDNSRLTEAVLVKELMLLSASQIMVAAVCQHAKWQLRRDVQLALLMSSETTLSFALRFAQLLPVHLVRDVLYESRLPEAVKLRIREQIV